MIFNKTRHFTIIKEEKVCRSIFCKAFGLMFRTNKPKDALVFAFDNERIAALHMLFVFFPIDVLFLDKNKKVVDIKKDFKPFSYYSPKARAMYVVELPTGVVGKTKIGDKISF
jgi:uncharacterized membrane protein (UPF0127 family)